MMYLREQQLIDDQAVKSSSWQAKARLNDYLLHELALPSALLAKQLAAFLKLPQLATGQLQHCCLEEKALAYLESQGYLLIIARLAKQHLLLLSDISDLVAIRCLDFKYATGFAKKIITADEMAGFWQQREGLKRAKTATGLASPMQAFDVIAWLQKSFEQAVYQLASDLHFEPSEKHFCLRHRIDGRLQWQQTLDKQFFSKVVTRLKVLAGLNIAESRKPQDGRLIISSHLGKKEARISILPTLWGEKIVIRLLQDESQLLSLTQIGLNTGQRQLLLQALDKMQGMILVTGATGSGKTTSLYACLHHLNQPQFNVLTIEDPIEITLKGINQTRINAAAGYHFASALRSFLRLDPDVMMIGEMRDKETASLALQAAETGHLVLSTLHTNSALEALNRLQHMGLSPLHLAASIRLIIAQRLLRKLCPHCRKVRLLTDVEQQHLKLAAGTLSQVYQAVGCKQCYQGYRGRCAIFECLPLAELVQQHAAPLQDHASLLMAVKKSAYPRLHSMALKKLQAGDIALADMLRLS